MSSEMAKDLQKHLSQRLQAIIREHVDRAALVLDPVDTLFMLLASSVDASCCAIASIVGTLVQNDGSAEAAPLIATMVDQHGKMLDVQKDVMLAKIHAALDARKAVAS